MINKKSFSFHFIIIIIINFLNFTPTQSYWKSWQLQTQDLSILLTRQQIYIYAYITGIFFSLIGIVIRFISQTLLSKWIKKNISTFQIFLKILQSFSLSIIIGSMFYHVVKDNFSSEFTQQFKSYIIFFAALSFMYIGKQVQNYFINKNDSFYSVKIEQFKRINQKTDEKSRNLDTFTIQKIEEQNQDNKYFIQSDINNEQSKNQTPTSSQQLGSPSTKRCVENSQNKKQNSWIKYWYLFGQFAIKSIQLFWIGTIIAQSFSTGHFKYYFHNLVALFFYQVSFSLRENYNCLEKQLDLEQNQKLKEIQNIHLQQPFLRKFLKYKFVNLFIFVGVLVRTHPYFYTKLSYEHAIASIAAYYIFIMGLLQAQCFKFKKFEDFLVLIPQIISIILGTIIMVQIQENQPIQPDHWHIYSPSVYK